MLHALKTFSAICLFSIFSASALAAVEKPNLTAPRAYMLDCGSISMSDFGWFSDTGEYDGKHRELAGSCILVGHSKGWLLWDTGLKKAFLNKPTSDGGFTFSLKKTIATQLAEIGLKPEDITFVAFSHFHYDHTGQANDFAKSNWILQQKELDALLAGKMPKGSTDSDTLSAYKTAKTTMINGDHDVFGDGKVRLLYAPGHTPGHQVLMVKLNSGTVVFSGDLFHQIESRKQGYIPVFNTSRAETEASIHRIERIVKNEHADFVIQHEKQDVAKFPQFPEYRE